VLTPATAGEAEAALPAEPTMCFSEAIARVSARLAELEETYGHGGAANTMTDTLPTAELDVRLFYSLGSRSPGIKEGVCRVRVYRSDEGETILVCSDIPEPFSTNSTDPAEYVWPRAWAQVGSPWPCIFVEHNAGRPYRPEDSLHGERVRRLVVSFDIDERPLQHREPRPYHLPDPTGGTMTQLPRFGAVQRDTLTVADFRMLVHSTVEPERA
jgi:hypothetical protein